LDLAIGDVEFTPEAAVPLGLILNEFVTNSLKYAFDGQGGIITVGVELLAEGRVRLRLSDNGKGLPLSPDGQHRAPAPGCGSSQAWQVSWVLSGSGPPRKAQLFAGSSPFSEAPADWPNGQATLRRP
jgi:anti-sigma regulatory factor (Ser/Thr protein kinase)